MSDLKRLKVGGAAMTAPTGKTGRTAELLAAADTLADSVEGVAVDWCEDDHSGRQKVAARPDHNGGLLVDNRMVH